MADDTDTPKVSLAEIKLLLENKKKEDNSDGITAEVFTDPRFIELFESYFKPLIDSSKDIRSKLTDKKKVSVFDILGISDRIQDIKRDAIIKEVEKLTEKFRNIAKNLGSVRNYTITDIMGLTKTERTVNRSIINNAIRALSLNIHKTAKNLGDSKMVMKFIGLKPIKMPNGITIAKVNVPQTATQQNATTVKNNKALPPAVINTNLKVPKIGLKNAEQTFTLFMQKMMDAQRKHDYQSASQFKKVTEDISAKVIKNAANAVKQGKSGTAQKWLDVSNNISAKQSTTGLISPSANNITSANQPTLAQEETKEREVVNVAVVDVSDRVKDWYETIANKGMGGSVDKGAHTGSDRESYSHSANALTRLAVLAAMLGITGITALLKGLFDQGPLKGVEKMVASYSLQFAAKIGKGAMHYIGNFFPKIMKGLKQAFSGELGMSVAKSFVKGGMLGKAAARLIGFIGKIAKKIPGIGLLISLGFAINRFANGDIQGGLIDLASGAASTIPIIGTAASIGLDLLNAQADIASGGVTPNKKGWLGKFNSFISKWFARIIVAQLNLLPFGLGKKVAGWMGISMEGLEDTAAGDDDPSTTNPSVQTTDLRVKNAQNIRAKAEQKKKEILGDKSIEELTPDQQAEYNKQDGIVQRADKSIKDHSSDLRGTSVKKTEDDKNKTSPDVESPKTPNEQPAQTPAASAEQREQDASDAALQDDLPAEVRVDRPVIEQHVRPVTKDDETVNTLKQINANLENMKPKDSSSPNMNIPNINVSSTNSGGGGNNGSSALRLALETTRDTAYTNRERNRGMILDFRGTA